jgi:hypothetical protein
MLLEVGSFGFLPLDHLCEWHTENYFLNNHNFYFIEFLHHLDVYVVRNLNHVWDVSEALLIFNQN